MNRQTQVSKTVKYSSQQLRASASLFFTATLLISLSACESNEIKQYKVAKAIAASVLPASQTDAAPFTFSLPTGWQKQANSGMRIASFTTTGGGDVSVVTLPGMAGDLKSNVNRWRGQVGLAPLDDLKDVQQSVQNTTIDGHSAVMLELYAPEGKEDKAMRVVLLEKNGVNWFFKLAGTRALVKQEQKAFESFAKSLKFNANAQPPAMMPPADGASNGTMSDLMAPGTDSNAPNTMPPNDMNAPGAPSIAPVETDTRLTYKLPAKWTEKEASAMRVASFEAKEGNQVADVSIVTLAGDGGGMLANTNRWRKQLEMAPTDEAGLKNSVKDIQVDGHKGYYLALYTALEGNGMLIALLEQGGQTWFIKMTGPSKWVQSQEKDFQAFVQSIRFHKKGSQT